jgi:predicted Zn finger-like uncharacterized protein
MNVTCPACSVRYTIPDDKVVGHRARMTCKRCGATITIDATDRSGKPVVQPHHVREPGRDLSPESPWNIAQPSGKRERLTTAALLDRYASNAVEPGSLVWRDGMENWLPPYDVPELAQALSARGLHVPGAALFGSDAEESTRAFDTRSLGSASLDLGVPGWREPGREKQASWNDSTRALGEAEATELKRQTMATPPGAFKSDDVTRAVDLKQYALGADANNWRAAVARPTPAGAPAPAAVPASVSKATHEVAPFTAAPRGVPVRRDSDATRVFDSRSALDASVHDEATRMFDARSALEAAAAPETAPPKRDARAPFVAAPAAAALPKFGPRNELEAASQEDATRMFDARSALKAAAQDDRADTFDTQGAFDAAANESKRPPAHEDDEATRLFDGKSPAPPLDTVRVPPPGPLPQRAPTPVPGPVPAPRPPAAPSAVPTPAKPHAAVPRPSAPSSSPHAAPPPSSPSAPRPTPSAPRASAPPAPSGPHEATPYAWVPPGSSPLAAPPPSSPTASHSPASPVPPPSAPQARSVQVDTGPAFGEEPSTAQQITAMRAALRPRRSRPFLWIAAALVIGAGAAAAFELGPTLPYVGKYVGRTAAPETTGPDFDATAAGKALEDAATTASRCKVPDGPTGPGRVNVKYLPTGRVESAKVSDPYAGTDVGECLLNVFENTRVPAFGGKPVIVGKNFEL